MSQSSPRIEQLAPELAKIVSQSEPIQHLADGFGGAQGPAEGRDGCSVTRIYEQYREHAWPGQPAEYDIRLLGCGSSSHVKFTDLMISEIASSAGSPIAAK